jgi:hypothetical protein
LKLRADSVIRNLQHIYGYYGKIKNYPTHFFG